MYMIPSTPRLRFPDFSVRTSPTVPNIRAVPYAPAAANRRTKELKKLVVLRTAKARYRDTMKATMAKILTAL